MSIGDDNLQLIDFSEEDDYLIDFPFRDSLEDFRLSVSFDDVNLQVKERSSHGQFESEEPRRPSFLRKSLAWDSAFFTSAGVLNPEELHMINKGFRKVESNQSSSGTLKDVRAHKLSIWNQRSSDSDGFRLRTLEASKKTNISSQNKVKSVRAPKIQNLNLQVPKSIEKMSSVPNINSSKPTSSTTVEGPTNVKMEIKTRKALAAPDLTVSKRSRWGDLSGLPKSTSFISPTTEKNSKVHQSYESSSSASSSKKNSKSIRRKFDYRKTKLTNSPSTVHFPLSSTCSSSYSPASSIDGMFSESLSLTNMTPQNTIPASDFQCRNYLERKLTSQNATRSSIGTTLFSSGPKRKIKSSGLRMPSPKIGFFDEEPMFKGSMQDRFVGQSPMSTENRPTKLHSSNISPFVSTENCLKVRKVLSREHDGRKVGTSCSKLKPDRQIPKEISKNRMMNLERKGQKDGLGSFEGEKENVCRFEDQVNGLSRHFEVINLDQDVEDVKGKRVHELLKCGQLSLSATHELTAPCTRTPLAVKMLYK